MKNNYSHLPLKSLQPQFTKWQKLLNANQIVHLYFLPYSGILYRTYQFRDWYNKTSKAGCCLMDLDIGLINEPHLLSQYLNNLKSPAIIIARRIFFGDKGYYFAQALQEAAVQTKHGILIVHEGSPLEIKLGYQSLPSVMYHQKLLYEPVVNKNYLMEYCQNIAKDWGVALLPKDFATWHSHSQHQLLLYNDLLRSKIDSPLAESASLLTSPSFINKCQLIWEGLPIIYREYYLNSNPDNLELESELSFFGLPTRNSLHTHPYLEYCFNRSRAQVLVISESLVKYNNVDITKIFTQAERLILSKLIISNTPVSREDIGKLCWPLNTEVLYSDWALDQVISRLRKKIQQHHLPVVIRTLRGRGYVLTR